MYLTDQWGCVNGHAWTEASNWYDPATGVPVTPYWLQPGYTPAPAAAPQPAPAAVPVAQPAVAPQPEPAPVPVAAPMPSPEPAPMASPAPVVAAEPVVAPAPQPAAVAPTSAPEPAAVAPAPAPAPEPAPAPAPAEPVTGAPVASVRDQFLVDLMATFAQYPNYAVAYGIPETDVTIAVNVAAAQWATGSKRVDYSAILKTVEAERTVYFWEMLKEQSSGLSFGSVDTESTTTFGASRSGTVKQVLMTTNGPVEIEWDYGQTRAIVESVAARHGLTIRVVLRKKSAQW